MKIFTNVKKIFSRSGELHFSRFAIIETPCFSIYIHKIYKADKDKFRHSHPWNFFGIVLKGKYIEEVENDFGNSILGVGFKTKKLFSIGYGNRDYFHKIKTVISPVTTLFITWGYKKPWFFRTYKGLVESTEFINNKDKYQ